MVSIHKRRRWLFWLAVLAAIATVVVISSFVALAILARQAHAEWSALAEQIRARGEPLTHQDIAAQRTDVPAERNAASVIEQAGKLAQLTEEEERVLSTASRAIPLEPVPSGQLGQLRELVAAKEPVFSELDRLKQCSGSRLEVSYEKWMLPSRKDLEFGSTIRLLGRLTDARGITDLAAGDIGRVIESNFTLLRLSAAAFEEPSFNLQLVGQANDAVASGCAMRLLASTSLSAEELRVLHEAWLRHVERNSMEWALRGGRADIVATYDPERLAEVLSWAGQETDKPDESSLWEEFTILQNQINGVRVFNDLIQAASNPAELIKVAAAKSAAIPKWSPTWSHIRILMPSQERAFVLWARSLAYNRSVLLAIAAERFRLQQGRWPTNAEELAPDYLKTIPDDPFTGHPMVFIHSNDGVTAYSVGENGADDGGLVEPLGGERLARDFGFHLPAPEKRGSIVQQHESEKE